MWQVFITFARKSSNVQNFLNFWKSSIMGTLCQKWKKKLGVTTLVSEISYVVDHAKLPNLVIVAVLKFICFWRKMKAFRPLEGRRCDEIILNGSIK